MALAVGSTLGSYKVLSLVAAGGMGEVYPAKDTRLGRTVAIKVLTSEDLADESRRRRLVHEARAASALNHPNIVTIHEIDSADGIVHHDLKAANVLVSDEGAVKVLEATQDELGDADARRCYSQRR